MQINRGLLSWGVFLIVAGLIPLALRAGWLSASQIAGWWNLWPLVLIGIGVGLVLTRTPFEVLGSLLVAGTLGLMLGAVLAIGIAGFPGGVCSDELGSTAYDEQTGAFDGPADVDIEFNCGDLAVTGAGGSMWTFAGSGDGEVAPDIEADGSSLQNSRRRAVVRSVLKGRALERHAPGGRAARHPGAAQRRRRDGPARRGPAHRGRHPGELRGHRRGTRRGHRDRIRRRPDERRLGVGDAPQSSR